MGGEARTREAKARGQDQKGQGKRTGLRPGIKAKMMGKGRGPGSGLGPGGRIEFG